MRSFCRAVEPKLILILNHKCNLRCRYCPTLRGRDEIDLLSAVSAVRIFLAPSFRVFRIKFSGGEPLLSFDLMKDIIAKARRAARVRKKRIGFEVTTNATLLTRRHLEYFEASPDVSLNISLDGDRATQKRNRKGGDSFGAIYGFRKRLQALPHLCVNMVVAPNAVHKMCANYLFLRSIGFERVNILPAFFVLWGRERLATLRRQFVLIARRIRERPRGAGAGIRNLSAWEPLPLFNTGWVVDCDGDIFLTNVHLARRYAHLRERLRIGNVASFPSCPGGVRSVGDVVRLIERHTSPAILHATGEVNQALTEFVRSLQREPR